MRDFKHFISEMEGDQEDLPPAPTKADLEKALDMAEKWDHKQYAEAVKEYLTGNAQSRPLMLLGPSGIGKTVGLNNGVQAAAKQLNKKVFEVDVHAIGGWAAMHEALKVNDAGNALEQDPQNCILRLEMRGAEVTPSFFLGMPASEHDTETGASEVKIATPGLLHYILKPGRIDDGSIKEDIEHDNKTDPGVTNLKHSTKTWLKNVYKVVFFFDEFTRAQSQIQNFMMKTFEVGSGFDPERVVFVGAGNYGPGFDNVSLPTDVAIKDRFQVTWLKHDPDLWLNYFKKSGGHELISDFIQDKEYIPTWNDMEKATELDTVYAGKTYAIDTYNSGSDMDGSNTEGDSSSTTTKQSPEELESMSGVMTPRNLEKFSKQIEGLSAEDLIRSDGGQMKLSKIMSIGGVRLPRAWRKAFQEYVVSRARTSVDLGQGYEQIEKQIGPRVKQITKSLSSISQSISMDTSSDGSRPFEAQDYASFKDFLQGHAKYDEIKTFASQWLNMFDRGTKDSCDIDKAKNIVNTLLDDDKIKEAITGLSSGQIWKHIDTAQKTPERGQYVTDTMQPSQQYLSYMMFLCQMIWLLDVEDTVSLTKGSTNLNQRAGVTGTDKICNPNVLTAAQKKLCGSIAGAVKQFIAPPGKAGMVQETLDKISSLVSGVAEKAPSEARGVVSHDVIDTLIDMVHVLDDQLKCVQFDKQNLDKVQDGETESPEQKDDSDVLSKDPLPLPHGLEFPPVHGKKVAGTPLPDIRGDQKEMEREAQGKLYKVPGAGDELIYTYTPRGTGVEIKASVVAMDPGEGRSMIHNGKVLVQFPTKGVIPVSTKQLENSGPLSSPLKGYDVDIWTPMSMTEKQNQLRKLMAKGMEEHDAIRILDSVVTSKIRPIPKSPLDLEETSTKLFHLIHGREGS
jgi:MoxR-like ATPase